MTTSHEDPTFDGSLLNVRAAFLPRLGSLLAIAPLGVWTCWHLWENTWAFKGAQAWESHVTVARHPLVELITSAIVMVPLVLHTVWGIRRLFIMRPNLGRYRNFGNVKYILQRLSAIGLLAFLPAHIWLARLSPLIQFHRHETFNDLAQNMRHHTPTLVVYTLGVLGTAYHLANGLATAGMTWGFAASPRAMRRMSTLSYVFFAV